MKEEKNSISQAYAKMVYDQKMTEEEKKSAEMFKQAREKHKKIREMSHRL